MVFVDVPKLRGKMAERGYSITSISEDIGVNRNTMSSYLENPEKMPYSVVAKLADILCDTRSEAAGIFLADNFRDT
jgi:predicted transcriptional regulator